METCFLVNCFLGSHDGRPVCLSTDRLLVSIYSWKLMLEMHHNAWQFYPYIQTHTAHLSGKHCLNLATYDSGGQNDTGSVSDQKESPPAHTSQFNGLDIGVLVWMIGVDIIVIAWNFLCVCPLIERFVWLFSIFVWNFLVIMKCNASLN